MSDNDKVKLTIYTEHIGSFATVLGRKEALDVQETWEHSIDVGQRVSIAGRLNDVDANYRKVTVDAEDIRAIDIIDVNADF